MSEHFDLVIAGGSFAGLACARTAALRGLKVAVLDPKLEPGARPRTTGIVVKEACDDFDLPAHLMRKVRGVRLYAPDDRAFDLHAPG
jgi:flavin-dependent dehydrogenase